MARAYSQDVRDRVIDAALAGLSARGAAERFGVGEASAIVWVRQARQTGERQERKKGQPRAALGFSRPPGADVQKKTAYASEQDRPDVKTKREAWFEGQPGLDPAKPVFIDETWTTTNMARKCGRAPKGERLRASVPHGHWKTTNFVGALRRTGMTAYGSRLANRRPVVFGLY